MPPACRAMPPSDAVLGRHRVLGWAVRGGGRVRPDGPARARRADPGAAGGGRDGRPAGDAGGDGGLRPGRQRRRRGDRRQRRDRRDRTAPVRPRRRPVRHRAHAGRRARRPQRHRPGRLRVPTPPRCAPRATRAMPMRHDIRTATVPGAVDGWMLLHERFGSLDLATILAPAVRLAASGFPASPLLVRSLGRSTTRPASASPSSPSRPTGPAPAPAGPGVALTLQAIVGRRPRRVLRRRVRRGPPRARRRPLHRGRPRHRAGRLGHAADGAARGASSWPRSARTRRATCSSARPGSPTRSASRPTPPTPAWAHLLVEAAATAGFDRPDVLHDAADGAALVAAIEARAELVDRRPGRTAAGRGGARRHHVPVHGRRDAGWPSA